MLKGEQYEITVSTPEKMIDKCYVIMDILSVNINLEKKKTISTSLINAYIFLSTSLYLADRVHNSFEQKEIGLPKNNHDSSSTLDPKIKRYGQEISGKNSLI